jgi:PrtD family type I secretion system ABC transporter
MQPAIESHWQQSRDTMMSRQALASDRNATVSSGVRFARLVLQSLMLGTGAWLAIDGIILPATIFATSIILGRALVPVEQGVSTWKQFTEAREGYRQVRELLREVPMPAERTVVSGSGNGIEAEEVSFSIPERRKPILADISFRIQGGSAVGIVGPSGSGKSTLARLLIGAIEPSEGRLRFGGMDYRKWDPDILGRQIGYLPQDVGLFAGTVRENIARFGDTPVETVIEAARGAGIHDMIMELPQHYDTVLGPSGVGLSGGQRQRLALARALLERPSFLVLDEPNANLDAAGEQGLRSALLDLKATGSTIVVVTHRQTILDVVDGLMFIREGRLEIHDEPEKVYAHIKEKVVPAMRTEAA